MPHRKNRSIMTGNWWLRSRSDVSLLAAMPHGSISVMIRKIFVTGVGVLLLCRAHMIFPDQAIFVTRHMMSVIFIIQVRLRFLRLSSESPGGFYRLRSFRAFAWDTFFTVPSSIIFSFGLNNGSELHQPIRQNPWCYFCEISVFPEVTFEFMAKFKGLKELNFVRNVQSVLFSG